MFPKTVFVSILIILGFPEINASIPQSPSENLKIQ